MDCATAREALNTDTVDGPAKAHLDTCPLCAVSVPGESSVSGALLVAIQADQAAEAGWKARLRNRSTTARLVVGALLSAALLTLVGVGTIKPNIALYPLPRLAIELGIVVAVVGLGLRFALWPLHRKPLGKFAIAAVGLGILVPIGLALAPMAHVPHPTGFVVPGEFAKKAIGCLIFGTVVALPVLITLLLAGRSRAAASRQALVAMAASAVGVGGLVLHCPITESAHMFAGHVPVAVLFVGMALVAFRIRNGKAQP